MRTDRPISFRPKGRYSTVSSMTKCHSYRIITEGVIALAFHNTVKLVPWSSDWEKRFDAERKRIRAAFSAANLPEDSILHVGSTSIRGMLSKPIIDVLVIVPDNCDLIDYEIALADAGYASLGECGRKDRIFLVRGDTPEEAFYAHLTYADNPVAQEQLLFQRIEREEPQIAALYAVEKARLADQYHDDRAAYRENKGPFIQAVLSA